MNTVPRQHSALPHMNVVILGHVDHGKSTVIGRLLADTNSLPQGKLDHVKALCRRTARPFEYAFLLDALKDEQDQGITIDAARCFFRTFKRRYLVFDAPGHVEFLRNMITGAAKAEAAFLVIDAHEGVKENSRRHGYIASMLGLRHLSVLVNKMDLAQYSREVFVSVQNEYAAFLERLNVHPASFIPLSAMHGDNIVRRSERMPWYDGPTTVEQLDAFEKEHGGRGGPLRLPVQDIYKFSGSGDERRIFAGTLTQGELQVGDEIVFLPSGKRSRVGSIEAFNAPSRTTAVAGRATGFTVDTQVYVKPGELVARSGDALPQVGTRFRANLFWMGRAPMIRDKRYKLKIAAARVPLKLVEIIHVLDVAEMTTDTNKQQIERHDVAECILEALRPFAFDPVDVVRETGRFVIVDNHEIAGAGMILEKMNQGRSTVSEHVREREFAWSPSAITSAERSALYGHRAKFLVFTGDDAEQIERFAAAVERHLFRSGFQAYCLRLSNVVGGLGADLAVEADIRDEHIRRLGELARIMTDSGQIFITAVPTADDSDIEVLKLLNQPNDILVVHAGDADAAGGHAAVQLAANVDVDSCIRAVWDLLREKEVIDFAI